MKRGAALAAGAAALAVAALASGKRPPKAAGRGPLALVGDSNAVGLRHPLGGLALVAGVRFMADAQGGSGVLQWPPERVRAATLGARVVVVSMGGNDYQRTWETPGRLTAAVRAFVRACPARPWWLNTPFDPDVLPDRMGIDAMWLAAGVRPLSPELLPNAGDGVHYSPDGYRALADFVWQRIAAAGELPALAPL